MYTRILLFPLTAIFIFLIACQEKEKAPEQTTSQKPTMAAPTPDTSASSDTARAGQYVATAEEFLKQAKYDSAIVYFEQASLIYKAKAN
jgi:hypothetical protein